MAYFDNFSENLQKPTWVILEYAAQRTSYAFKAHIPAWETRGLFIKYLQAYY